MVAMSSSVVAWAAPVKAPRERQEQRNRNAMNFFMTNTSKYMSYRCGIKNRDYLAANAAVHIIVLRADRVLHGCDVLFHGRVGRAVEGSEGKAGTKEQKGYKLFHDEYLKIYVVLVWDEKQGLPSGRGGNSRYRAAVRQDAAGLRCPLLWSHGRHRKESPKPDMTASLQL